MPRKDSKNLNKQYVRIDKYDISNIKNAKSKENPNLDMSNEFDDKNFSKQSEEELLIPANKDQGQIIQDKDGEHERAAFFASVEDIKEYIIQQKNILKANIEHSNAHYTFGKLKEHQNYLPGSIKKILMQLAEKSYNDLQEGLSDKEDLESITENHKILFHCPLILENSKLYDDPDVITTYFPVDKISFLETWITVVRAFGNEISYSVIDEHGKLQIINLNLKEFQDFCKFVMIAPLDRLNTRATFDRERIHIFGWQNSTKNDLPLANKKKYELFTIIDKLKNLMQTSAKVKCISR